MSIHRNNHLLVAVALGVLALMVGLGWLARDRFLPVEVGTSAPSFVASDLSGQPVSLADLEGEVVLLNIWATWCEPCKAEMPSMQRLHEILGPRGLRIVAVSIDALPGQVGFGGRPGGDVRTFAQRLGISFTIWRDPSSATARQYRTLGIPESFVIGRDGTIVKKVIGPTDWDSPANIDLFRRLLDERA
jgi:thiol-disulfide isomerase/thioredoxin